MLRWHRLRTLLRSNSVDVLPVQEHRYKQHVGESKQQAEERLEKVISKFKWINWESESTLAETPNSGLVTFWRKDKFKLVAKYEMEQRVLQTILQDDDGVQWTVVNVHFHNDAGQRRLQWTLIKDKIPNIQKGNLIMLADHNSVLDKNLDQHPAVGGEGGHKAKGREREQEAYMELQLLDAWPIVHEPDVLDEDSKGLTRQHRRIDRASVSAELATVVVGVYTIPIGRSDHKGVVLQLSPGGDGDEQTDDSSGDHQDGGISEGNAEGARKHRGDAGR